MSKLRLGIMLLLVASGFNMPAHAGTLAKTGEIIATDACTACHKVGPHQKQPGGIFNELEQEDVRAPSFADIAARHGHDPAYLRRAITMPKHPMREQDWNEKDLKAVIAYIRSLKGQKPSPKPVPH